MPFPAPPAVWVAGAALPEVPAAATALVTKLVALAVPAPVLPWVALPVPELVPEVVPLVPGAPALDTGTYTSLRAFGDCA